MGNCPSRIRAKKNTKLSRAAKRGGFQTGGFPIRTCPSFLSFFVLFGTFPIFRDFPRFARGLSGNFPDLSFFPGPFPKKSGTQLGLGNPGLASLKTRLKWPIWAPFLTQNSPEKVYVSPLLRSFLGNEAHKLFSRARIGLFGVGPKCRNTPSTAGNSMISSERPEPILKKRGVPSRTGGERIPGNALEASNALNYKGCGASQPYSRGKFQETL